MDRRVARLIDNIRNRALRTYRRKPVTGRSLHLEHRTFGNGRQVIKGALTEIKPSGKIFDSSVSWQYSRESSEENEFVRNL